MTSESCVKLLSSTKNFNEALTKILESGKQEIDRLLEPFANYCIQTELVRQNAEQIEEKNVQMQCVNENLQKLNSCLQNIIENVYYEEKDEEYLLTVDLTNPKNITDVLKIASKLTESDSETNFAFDKALLKSKAIHDQFRRLHKLREKFTLKVYQLFKNILSLSVDVKAGGTAADDDRDLKQLAVRLQLPPKHLLTTSLTSSVSSSSSSTTTTSSSTAPSVKSQATAVSLANLKYLKSVCENTHRNLVEYAPLMSWLRTADSSTSDQFQKHYMEILSQFYEKLIRLVFEIESGRIPKKVAAAAAASKSAGDTSTLLNISTLTSASSASESLNASNLETSHFESSFSGGSSSHLFLLGAENFGAFSKSDADDHLLLNCLNEVEEVFREEEQFFGSFFFRGANVPSSEKEAKKILKNNLIQLFATFESELKQFNGQLELLNGGCFSMNILIDLSNFIVKDSNALQSLNTSTSSGSSLGGQSPHYLNEVLAANLIQAKRSFDKFMNWQIQSVRDAKLPKRVPCGLLFYVQNLERFVKVGRPLLESQRRVDLEKWYARLIDTILEYVRIHAESHSKTPPEVIKIENYHYLHMLLSQMKIESLQTQKKQAKTFYTEALEAYVARYFGKPLEKLNIFLDGVHSRLNAGVKKTEIQYQSAFSKQELRKVIQQYSKKEVKRGLEHLYRKMEKHFSDETNLTPVVWRAMEEEFIRQYKTIDEMIQSCYPGSMISMEVTIDDILVYFAEIK